MTGGIRRQRRRRAGLGVTWSACKEMMQPCLIYLLVHLIYSVPDLQRFHRLLSSLGRMAVHRLHHRTGRTDQHPRPCGGTHASQ